MDIRANAHELSEEMLAWRRDFHAHPELSNNEFRTTEKIVELLESFGCDSVERPLPTGAVALIKGGKPGKCVALRADFDALPIVEATGLPFSSENEGVCHACGHDMHTAGLLGAARVLCDLRSEFSGCVKLVFQPAEEDVLDSGAVKMIADGVLENPKVDAMFGQHIWPYYPVGKVAIRDGAMMASSDRFHITIRGKASHGSAPESGIDAIAAAAQVISALQTIVSRRVSPLDSAVVTIGTIHGGARYNVIADTVKLEGTCRNLNPEVRNKMEERIRAIVEGVCGGMGASGELEYFRGYSPTVNSHELFPFALETIREVVGEENAVIPESSALGGEDFSFYCERVPSIFFWTGILSPGAEVYPLHNGGLNPDEKALPIAIEVMTRCALKFLAGKK